MTSHNLNTESLAQYQDINEVLLLMISGIQDIVSKKLIGIYLFGSLTYGDFNPNSSDIDLLTVINRRLNHDELDQIKQLHKQIEEQCQKWSHRLESSYTPIDLFKNTLPPKKPRPYYGGGIFYEEAPYGNEWIIGEI
jgi:predicted nucleotidyltransferase